MKTMTARVLDPTHLELPHPLSVGPGTVIGLILPDAESDDNLWRDAAKAHLLDAYAEEDALYDDL